MSVLRIVSVDDKFFKDNDLYNLDNELIPNTENNHNRPYVIVLKLKFRDKYQDFAIPFRSNIAGHRDKFEYFALPPRKETKPKNIHGLHFIKMLPIDSAYFIKYNYPTDSSSATLTKQYIQKNLAKLVIEAQNYINKFEGGCRPSLCVDIGKIYDSIHKNKLLEKATTTIQIVEGVNEEIESNENNE